MYRECQYARLFCHAGIARSHGLQFARWENSFFTKRLKQLKVFLSHSFKALCSRFSHVYFEKKQKENNKIIAFMEDAVNLALQYFWSKKKFILFPKTLECWVWSTDVLFWKKIQCFFGWVYGSRISNIFEKLDNKKKLILLLALPHSFHKTSFNFFSAKNKVKKSLM